MAKRNRCHFADDIFKCIFLNKNVLISIEISLKFFPKDPINNIPSSVQIMHWRWPCNKPLSEPAMVSLLPHICITLPQWVNTLESMVYMPANEIYFMTSKIYLHIHVLYTHNISVAYILYIPCMSLGFQRGEKLDTHVHIVLHKLKHSKHCQNNHTDRTTMQKFMQKYLSAVS